MKYTYLLLFVASASACSGSAVVDGEPCEFNHQCYGFLQVCDVTRSPAICVSPICDDPDGPQCEAGCTDDPGDDCDPEQGDKRCPGLCECGDACFPDQCQTDEDCTFPEVCFGDFPTNCQARLCAPLAANECPEGAVCVDQPGSECQIATDSDCLGKCRALSE